MDERKRIELNVPDLTGFKVSRADRQAGRVWISTLATTLAPRTLTPIPSAIHHHSYTTAQGVRGTDCVQVPPGRWHRVAAATSAEVLLRGGIVSEFEGAEMDSG